jgi:hypothetical protein
MLDGEVERRGIEESIEVTLSLSSRLGFSWSGGDRARSGNGHVIRGHPGELGRGFGRDGGEW